MHMAIDFPARRCPRGAVEPPSMNSAHCRFGHSGAFRWKCGRATALRWLGRCRFLFAGADFCVALVSPPSAQAPPMAEALDSNRQSAARTRHIPIHNEGGGGLFASLEPRARLARVPKIGKMHRRHVNSSRMQNATSVSVQKSAVTAICVRRDRSARR